MTRADTFDEQALKGVIADALAKSRRRSQGLTVDTLDEHDLVSQHSTLMSPLVWDLAHVGNFEELWLLRGVTGMAPMRPEIDPLYDAFEHPRAERPQLPLLPPDDAVDYIGLVRRKVLDSLEHLRFDAANPLLRDGYIYGLVIQHEHQHDETMLATHQLRRGSRVLNDVPPPSATRPLPAAEVLVPAGRFPMGASGDPWALDNELPGHDVDVPAFWIDTTPVTNAAYRSFVDAHGYDDERWWSAGGWDWRCRSGKRSPAFWVREGQEWLRRRFGVVEPLPAAQPVQHVCFYEAEAYARWVGKRLPSEAEWEKAASWDPQTRTKHRYPWGDDPDESGRANLGERHHQPADVGAYPRGASSYGVQQLQGDVWEWTSSDFRPYPGFRAFPYREYSEVFFGPDYKVLRGGSWATDLQAARTTFRNWDYPIRRQIFAGFRCARDAAPGDGAAT
jgi:gamma-glutamyl hercynylcysteine S-oxide synthase